MDPYNFSPGYRRLQGPHLRVTRFSDDWSEIPYLRQIIEADEPRLPEALVTSRLTMVEGVGSDGFPSQLLFNPPHVNVRDDPWRANRLWLRRRQRLSFQWYADSELYRPHEYSHVVVRPRWVILERHELDGMYPSLFMPSEHQVDDVEPPA